MPHPRSYGNFPRVIAKYVRDEPVLSLPEAIRKMTSWPATRMRLAGRGALKEGNWADVVVFDLATIQDKATYEQPMQYPAGIEYVVASGFHPALVPSCCSQATTTMRLFTHRGAWMRSSRSAAHWGQVSVS